MTEDQKTNLSHRNRVNKGPVQIPVSEAGKDIRDAFRKMAETKAGQTVFRYLMEYCGYKYSSITMTPEGVLLNDAINHNESLRSVYLHAIRNNIPVALRNEIEADKEPEINVYTDVPTEPQKKQYRKPSNGV